MVAPAATAARQAAARNVAIRARRVLGRELDLVGPLRRVGNRPADALEHLIGCEAELALHVQGARGDEDVHAPVVGALECRDCGVDVTRRRAGERGNGRTRDRAGDGGDTVEIAWRGGGEARLDHVDAKPLEREPDLGFLGRLQGDARRLLAVSQSRVEDLDPAHSNTPRSGPRKCGRTTSV